MSAFGTKYGIDVYNIPTISCRACNIISMRTRRPGTSFGSRVVFGNYGGAQWVEESEVGFESFTT